MTEIERLKEELGAWRQRAEQAEAEVEVLQEELKQARAGFPSSVQPAQEPSRDEADTVVWERGKTAKKPLPDRGR